MAVGFATLGGGDTVSFDLNAGQITALHAMLNTLSPSDGSGKLTQVLTSFTATPADTTTGTLNVYSLDPAGFDPNPWVPPFADVIMADSTPGALSTDGTVGSERATLWVGNNSADTFSLAAPSQTVLAGDGDDSITLNSQFHGGGANEIWVGNGDDTLTMIGEGTIIAGTGTDLINVDGYSATVGDLVSVSGSNDTINIGQDTTDFGQPNNVTVDAGDGSNLININAANYVITTGTGADTINITGGSGVINVGGSATIHAATYNGGGVPQVEAIQGGSGNLTFFGGNNDWDTVTAGTGTASLVSSQGTAYGHDFFDAGGSSSAVLDASGGGINEFATLVGGTGGHTTMIGGGGTTSFIGESGASTATGGSGYNYFNANFSGGPLSAAAGATGDMSMTGGSGWNFFYAGAGDETINAFTSNFGTTGQDLNRFFFQDNVSANSTINGFQDAGAGPNADYGLNLTFSGYGLTADQIVADSTTVAGGGGQTNTVVTLGGGTTITITNFSTLQDWMIHTS